MQRERNSNMRRFNNYWWDVWRKHSWCYDINNKCSISHGRNSKFIL